MVRLARASIRNRNRQLSNKYRLKIVHGDIEVDPADFADEDMNTGQYMSLVAGVDAEDVNEHHLQEVLHASSQHVYFHRTRGARSGQTTPQTHAFIPTPDSTGIVEHYSDLYVPNRWKDPVTYLCTSTSLEESCTGALASNFTYYMDESDKEWLDKNNEAARGEGTNVQAVISPSVTRTPPRRLMRKKESLEPLPTLTISEDEFELVMGLFEKVAHEKTEYLHHGLENGMAFPGFSEYQDTFSSILSPASFAAYSVPQWIPTPSRLVSIARIIYQYWKERRIKRGGHRIIPIVNLDESDTLNESYVCFRGRETKTFRKTRASQVTSSEKLIRLQAELMYPLELGKHLLQREQLKRDCALYSQQVWEKRILLADFKRNFPSWDDKESESLFIDKDRHKTVKLFRPPKIKPEVMGAHICPMPIVMRPTERIARINHVVETILKRQKEEDRQWEDKVDDPYQIRCDPYSTRCFQYIPPPITSPTDTPKEARVYRALRTRIGRGGRFLLDRRNSVTPSTMTIKRPFLPEGEVAEVEEQLERMQERWRFDADDVPTMGLSSLNEMDRVLVDDYSPRFLRHAMTFFLDSDQQSLMNDPAIPVINNGHERLVVPLRPGLPSTHALPPGACRPGAPQYQFPSPIIPRTFSAQQHLKTMGPPLGHQMRISLNGGMRFSPAASSTIFGPPRSSGSNSTVLVRHSPSNSGVHRVAISLPHTDISSDEMAGSTCMLQTLKHDTDPEQDTKGNDCVVIPVRRRSSTATNSPIGTAIPQTSTAISNNLIQPGMQGSHGSTAPQMQNLKAAFASVQTKANQGKSAALQALPSYLQSGSANVTLHQHLASFTGSDTDLTLPATRQMQWASGALPSIV